MKPSLRKLSTKRFAEFIGANSISIRMRDSRNVSFQLSNVFQILEQNPNKHGPIQIKCLVIIRSQVRVQRKSYEHTMVDKVESV